MLELLIFGVLFAVSILLLIISLIKKLVFKPFYFIVILAAILSLAGGARSVMRVRKSAGEQESALERNIYISARLLEEDRITDSLSAAGAAGEEDPENEDVILLRAADMNRLGSFDLSSRLLEETSLDEDYGIPDYNGRRESMDSGQSREIAGDIIDRLDLSESDAEKYDMMMQLRYYSRGADVSSISADDFSGSDRDYAEIKLADIANDHGGAYKVTGDLADAGDYRAQIALSDLYSRGYVPHDYGRADEEYDDYLMRATLLQIEVDEMQEKLGEKALKTGQYAEDQEVKDYLLKQTEYQMAVTELDHIPELRAVNYLRSTEMDSQGDLAQHLQLARLFADADMEDEARKELDMIFLSGEIAPDKWLSQDILFVRDTFLDFLQTNQSAPFYSAYAVMMQDLSQGLSEGDVVFRDVLERYLRELYTQIRITSIHTGDYPRIIAEMSYGKEGSLTESMLSPEDTGTEITSFELIREDGGEEIAVSVVLDVSGSMAGNNIASAKSAIDAFISSLSGNIMLSFVTFASDANIIIPLTDSSDSVRQAVRRTTTYGGTNIASGLQAAQRSLGAFSGKKYIILLSDGYDGSNNRIDSVLQALSAAGIQTYTIGMQGADEAYLKKIADRTGGTFVFAKNTAQLNEVYESLQRSLMNRYYLIYIVTENSDAKDRVLRVNMTDSPAYDRKEYSLGFASPDTDSGSSEA
nr:VWA domain-containing protein [Clostridium sp.]